MSTNNEVVLRTLYGVRALLILFVVRCFLAYLLVCMMFGDYFYFIDVDCVLCEPLRVYFTCVMYIYIV